MNNQRSETYLNHPSFGLLYLVCKIKDNQDIFTTLYAQRLFFLVTTNDDSFTFDPISRSDVRLLIEHRVRQLRSQNTLEEYQKLLAIYQQTFQ